MQVWLDRHEPVDRLRQQPSEMNRAHHLAVVKRTVLAHVGEIRRHEAYSRRSTCVEGARGEQEWKHPLVGMLE